MTALPSTRELRALDAVEVVAAGCFANISFQPWQSPHRLHFGAPKWQSLHSQVG